MKVEYDPAKNTKNIADRDLPFNLVKLADWDTALVSEDTRNDYPERRYVAMACINYRLHVTCFTPIEGGIRVISLRKANKREVLNYEKQYPPC